MESDDLPPDVLERIRVEATEILLRNTVAMCERCGRRGPEVGECQGTWCSEDGAAEAEAS